MKFKLFLCVPLKGKNTLFIVQYQQQAFFMTELDINQIQFLIWSINGPEIAFIDMFYELNFVVDLGTVSLGYFVNFVNDETLPLVEDNEVVLIDFGH